MPKQAYAIVLVLALIWGSLLAILVRQPGYTDAYYYFNAGKRWAQGDGLTDVTLWTYLNAPDTLPGPSHTYWMPLESLVAGMSMRVFGRHFGAAQIPSVLCFAGLVVLAFWLGGRWGGCRHAWLAGLLVMFSGFYTPFWTTTDTFALFGVLAAGALVAIGIGRMGGRARWLALAGALSALAHLARADGLLLVGVALAMIWGPKVGWKFRHCAMLTAVTIIVYGTIMFPWFVRNQREIGSPLPSAGLQTIWLRGYDDLVNYPAGVSMTQFAEWGAANILRSRWEALVANMSTLIAVETWIVLGPLALMGVWLRRRDPIVQTAMLYGVGLHLAMTLVFAYPGYRGGLFHSSSALLPFWAALSLIGMDAVVEAIGRRRRWRLRQAKGVFGATSVVMAAVVSVGVTATRVPSLNNNGLSFRDLAISLPPDAVVMVNDPPAFYYHTGRAGVVIPNSDPDVVPLIATQYGVTHVILDRNRTEPFGGLFSGADSRPFLTLIRFKKDESTEPTEEFRLFEITQPGDIR